MTKILLQPYKIRENKFVPESIEPLKLDWEAYRKLLAPSNSPMSLLLLRRIKTSSYIGLIKKTNGSLINFCYIPNTTKNTVEPLIRQMPDVVNRLHSLYKVVSFDFGSRFKE